VTNSSTGLTMKSQPFLQLLGMHFLVFLLACFSSPVAAGVINASPNDQMEPTVAYNPAANEYLLVWEHEQSAGDHDVVAQRITPNGSLIGGLIYVANTGRSELAYSSTDYDIHGQRLTGAGVKTGLRIDISRLTNFEGHPAVAHNADNDEYLVLWEYLSGSDEFKHNDIRGLKLNRIGAPIGGTIVLDETLMDESLPQVAYGGVSDRYLVVWQEKQSGTGVYNIHGRMVSTSGVLLAGEMTIAQWEYDLVKPRLAFNPNDNEFLVVWEDHRWGWGDDWNIDAQRMTGTGYFSRENFGIAWRIPGRSNHRLSPDVAYKPAASEYLVAWEYAYSPTDFDIYVRRVAADGGLIEGEIPVVASGIYEGHPVVASDNGLSYLVAWEQWASGSGQGMDLYGKAISLQELSGHVYAGYEGETRTALGDVQVDTPRL
jgi:hypothetical protein